MQLYKPLCEKKVKCDRRTDRPSDGQTDGPTDTVAYRVAWTRLKTRARWETLNCVINKLQMCLKARLSFWPDIRMYITVRRTKRSDKSLVMGMFFTNDAILTNAGIWSHFSPFIFSSPFKFLSFELLSSQNLFIFLFVTTTIPSENRLSLCCFIDNVEILRKY